jgi:acid phosphatase (class A)
MKSLRLRLLLSILLALAFAIPASARSFLQSSEIEASRILPPPPVDNSPAAKAELAELEQIVAARTPAALAQAVSDDATEDPTVYRDVIGPGFDLKALPATARMLDDVMEEQRAAANAAKKFFARSRPWVAAPELQTCAMRGGVHASYPSGHATMGYAVGVVLAGLIPNKSQAILARARIFSENRLVCGMHYRSDIVAGQALGTAVAVALIHNPEFKVEYAVAEQELKAANLAP